MRITLHYSDPVLAQLPHYTRHTRTGGNFLKSVVTASETYDVAKLQFFAADVSHLTLASSSSAAISDFTEAIRLRPGWSSAYFNMGGANFYLGQFDKAIGELDGAIRLKPDYDAYFYRGLAYDSLKQYSKAIA